MGGECTAPEIWQRFHHDSTTPGRHSASVGCKPVLPGSVQPCPAGLLGLRPAPDRQSAGHRPSATCP